MDTSALCRPVVYITVRDRGLRHQIGRELEKQGWAVLEQPTGFHLIQAIADVIEGHRWRAPELIVVDAIAPGCAGTTIATGLRELGVDIPVVLIRTPGQALTIDPAITVVEPENAVRVVAELARPRSPLNMLDTLATPRASA